MREYLLGDITLNIGERKLTQKSLHRRGLVINTGLNPLPLLVILPLFVFNGELTQLASAAVAINQNILLLRHILATGIVLLEHHFVEVCTLLVWQEVNQRLAVVAVCTNTHRDSKEQTGEQQLLTTKDKNLVVAVAVPYNDNHWQHHQILKEGLPRRELQRIAKATTIFDRYPRRTQECEHRKERHRHQRKD